MLSNRLSNRFDNRVNVCNFCLYTRYSQLSNLLSNRLYNLVWQPIERTAVRSTGLSNRLANPFDNRLYRVYKHSTGCQSVFVKPAVQPGLTTGWTNSCSFNMVVKPVWQPVGWLFTRYSRLSKTVVQPVVSRKRGFRGRLLERKVWELGMQDGVGCRDGCSLPTGKRSWEGICSSPENLVLK